MYRLNNVTKKYRNQVILDEVSFVFPERGLVCLMGESGTGKSTLLNLLAGLDNDYQGKINFEQQDLSRLSANELTHYRKDYIGLVFQDYQLLEGYTALENVLMVGQLHKMRRVEKRATGLLEEVGLAEQVNQKIEQLSGGQKQRVAIARALLNDPKVILADEPTGALDRKTANDIMGLIQKVAKERLVILITHDPKICEFADGVISIEDKKIVVNKFNSNELLVDEATFKLTPYSKIKTSKLALKNVKVNIMPYLLLALMFAVAATSVLFSFSANNIMGQSIQQFQEKNSALSNGYIKLTEKNGKDVLAQLKTDSRISNCYQQIILKDIALSFKDKEIQLPEVFPTPKAKESISYGVMPRISKNEIAISGTLAKQLNSKIDELIGETIKVLVNQKELSLKISGIYNAGYDDLFISSDIEQQLMGQVTDSDAYSISFDVRDFKEIPLVYDRLVKDKLKPEMAVDEVKSMLTSFDKIKTIFMIITVLVLAVCLFILLVMLNKLQGTREKLVALLVALGFNRKIISRFLAKENALLALLSTVMTVILVVAVKSVAKIGGLSIMITSNQLIVLLVASFVIVWLLSGLLKQKLLRVSVIETLKK